MSELTVVEIYIQEIKRIKADFINRAAELMELHMDVADSVVDSAAMNLGFQRTLERYLENPSMLSQPEIMDIISLYYPAKPMDVEPPEEPFKIVFIPEPHVHDLSGVGFVAPTITFIPEPHVISLEGAGELVPVVTLVPEPHVIRVEVPEVEVVPDVVFVPEPHVMKVDVPDYVTFPTITLVPEPHVFNIKLPEVEPEIEIQFGIFAEFDHNAGVLEPEIVDLWEKKTIKEGQEFDAEFPNELGHIGIVVPLEAAQPKQWREHELNDGTMGSVFAQHTFTYNGKDYVLYVTKEKTQFGQDDQPARIVFKP